jgi:wyosine [tRNA(Phe)-imidazoG37] synthetase (radical SAM superfamily)
MDQNPYRYIFGPVPSRRLGLSLGLDLVPFKTCSFDCLYCQLGPTTHRTLERLAYVPVEDILGELRRRLDEGLSAQYLTLSGSGEPTLHKALGELIHAIKEISPIPLAVLTNGSLLWDDQVRQGLAEADLVMPSLDAGQEALFRHVNRPHPDLSFERTLDGLGAFCAEFKGQVWLEVFLLRGLSDLLPEVEKIAQACQRIRPHRVHLNTVSRPPADPRAQRVPWARIRELTSLFNGLAEPVLDLDGPERGGPAEAREVDEGKILEYLRRRPGRVNDLARSLGVHPLEAGKHLDLLMRKGLLSIRQEGGEVYFMACQLPPKGVGAGEEPGLNRSTGPDQGMAPWAPFHVKA